MKMRKNLTPTENENGWGGTIAFQKVTKIHMLSMAYGSPQSVVFRLNFLTFEINCGSEYSMMICHLTKKAEPPPTRDVNRDSGTDSANGGWLRRLVRHLVHNSRFSYQLCISSGSSPSYLLIPSGPWNTNHSHFYCGYQENDNTNYFLTGLSSHCHQVYMAHATWVRGQHSACLPVLPTHQLCSDKFQYPPHNTLAPT